jgi:hypothetical protein
MSLLTRVRNLFARKPEATVSASDSAEFQPEVRVVRWLLLDRSRPRAHIAELWTDIVQRKRPIVSYGELQLYCAEAVEAMPEMSFASKEEEARTWGMLGDLYFKALHPEVEGNFDGRVPCPESRSCYEQAYRCVPDDWWTERMARH